jgi:hypothetical protein
MSGRGQTCTESRGGGGEGVRMYGKTRDIGRLRGVGCERETFEGWKHEARIGLRWWDDGDGLARVASR